MGEKSIKKIKNIDKEKPKGWIKNISIDSFYYNQKKKKNNQDDKETIFSGTCPTHNRTDLK